MRLAVIILVFVVAYAGLLQIGGTITVCVQQGRLRRQHSRLRWVPVEATTDHARHRATAAGYEALGYAVHSHGWVEGLAGHRTPVTVMHHADGTVVDVGALPIGVASSVSSVLEDGVLLDTVALLTPCQFTSDRRWVQAVADPAPAALVSAHREALAWLASCGWRVIVPTGGPAAVIELAARSASAGSILDVLQAQYTPKRYPAMRGRPLWEQPDVVARVARSTPVGTPGMDGQRS